MRHGTMAVLAAALLVGALGCKQEPENKRISVEQEPPFRTEAELIPDETATGDGTTNDEITRVYTGADDPAIDANTTAFEKLGPRKHVIVKGDTLYSLARRYLGHGRRWQEIQAANAGLDPRKLRVGQEIVIPAK